MTYTQLSPEKIDQLGWDDFILNQNQIEELNCKMQKDNTDIRNQFRKALFNEDDYKSQAIDKLVI